MERTVLITGSAKGLGAALALGLAKDGHRIAIQYRTSRREAEETLASIVKAGGAAAIFASPLASLIDGEKLINNAGVFNRSRFGELTQEEWDEGLASTAGAAFYATRAALPHLRASGRGRIVNIGDSMSDRTGFTEPAMSYYIGKVGLWMMTQTLALTEAPHRVMVNMVSPGVLEGSVCDTPLTEMPLGRFGTPDDVLGPVRFLLGEGAGALTGSNLHVGGGWNIAPFHASAINRAGYTKLPPDGTR